MRLDLDIQNGSNYDCPQTEQIEHWVSACLSARANDTEISIRIVDETEMTNLNRLYRGQDKPTNVLSFPADIPGELELPLLGDIVICASVIETEARQQHKNEISHWAHMLVHGTLHLLGYDHIEESQATEMESLEITILRKLGYTNPYESQPYETQTH
ncbi:rRNA maturation RNase YbeY [Halieaceae bacterium]|nr:rRNA maturation RNase YbeY [Halieaceae bacterium]